MGLFSNLLGTVETTFKIGRASLDASGLTGKRTLTLPDETGTLLVVSALAAALATKADLINPALTGGTTDGFAIGYRGWPYTGAAGNYTFVATDVGKCRAKTGTGIASFTLNANVFAAGDVLRAHNNANVGAVTLVAGAGVTMHLTGTTTTGDRTIAPLGRAEIYWTAPNICWVDGPGVT